MVDEVTEVTLGRLRVLIAPANQLEHWINRGDSMPNEAP
jgi:hypothetical protein